MPHRPQTKVALTGSSDSARETDSLTAAQLENILLTADGLETLQKLIRRNTHPPANPSIDAIATAIAAMLP